MYFKIFNRLKNPTTQAYCLFSCYTAISNAVLGTKKMPDKFALTHNKHVR